MKWLSAARQSFSFLTASVTLAQCDFVRDHCDSSRTGISLRWPRPFIGKSLQMRKLNIASICRRKLGNIAFISMGASVKLINSPGPLSVYVD